MIKALVRTPADETMIVFGLSGENVTRLVAGEPILVDLGDLGIAGVPKVAIMYGKTEGAIVSELKAAGVEL